MISFFFSLHTTDKGIKYIRDILEIDMSMTQIVSLMPLRGIKRRRRRMFQMNNDSVEMNHKELYDGTF